MADVSIDISQPQGPGLSLAENLRRIKNNFILIAQHIANAVDAHGLAPVLSVVSEIIAARGTMSSLIARLDVSLNPDGSLRVPVTQNNLSEWVNAGIIPARVNACTFTVSGDKTAIFGPFRKVNIQDVGSNNYSMVVGSTYNSGTGLTTVTVYDEVVPATPTNVSYGFITPGTPSGSLDLRMLCIDTETDYNTYGF